MNSVELLRVADVVDATPDSEWDMRSWFCGSAGFAISNYCKAYPDSPLKIENSEYYDSIAPRFGGKESYAAIAIFFEISVMMAEYLFCPYRYGVFEKVTRQEVSCRIRDYVKANQ